MKSKTEYRSGLIEVPVLRDDGLHEAEVEGAPRQEEALRDEAELLGP